MKKKEEKDFTTLVEQYLSIKGLDIIVYLKDGEQIELLKNRYLEKNAIVMFDSLKRVTKIPLNKVKSIDLFAA